MKQIKLELGKGKARKKKMSLEHRTLIAIAELKKLDAESKKVIRNNHRYYLHRKAKQYGLSVFATRLEVLITGDLNEKQAYYCSKLIALGYNIQEAIG